MIYPSNCHDNRFLYKIVFRSDGTVDWGWDMMIHFDCSVKDYNTYPKLFTINDLDSKEKILSILDRGMISPTYNPRRINRTLESNGTNK